MKQVMNINLFLKMYVLMKFFSPPPKNKTKVGLFKREVEHFIFNMRLC